MNTDCSVEFLRRRGLVHEPLGKTSSIDGRRLLAELELGDRAVSPCFFGPAEGVPPPDRGVTGEWPPEL